MNLLSMASLGAPHVTLEHCFGIEPLDPPRGHASGPAPYRVLLVGGAAIHGRGVLTHDLAVTGALARSLGRLIGHGVDTDGVVERFMDLQAAEDAIWSARLQYYDALVLVLDPGWARNVGGGFERRLNGLLIDAASRMPEASAVTVAVAPFLEATVIPPRAYAAAVASVHRAAHPGVRVVELSAPSPAPGPAELYAAWADQIADPTAAALREPALWSDSVDVVDDERRSRAATRLGPFDTQWTSTFRRVVSFASAAYGTQAAAISVIDDTTTHYTVCHGRPKQSAARAGSICDSVLGTYGGVIVGDARQDSRFAHLPPVVSGEVRFYAGYRINDADGLPVAVLCVFDSDPRPVLAQDIALLRDFALAAERRLWALTRERSSALRGVATA